jgi:hypothetical protein
MMRLGAIVVVATLAWGFTASPPAESHAAYAKRCGGIVFTPHSEDGVYRIRARRTSCKRARRVARAVQPLGIVDGPYSYRKAGFRCHGTLDDTILPVVHWRCHRGRARIVFDRA